MSYEPTASEQALLDQGRLLRAESQTILPLVRHKREIAIARLLLAFKAGDTERLLPATAELSAYEDIKLDIENKIKRAEVIERKLYEQG